MAKAKFDIKTEATRPLYAGVGVTDAAVTLVREYVADVQKRVSGIDLQPKAFREQAATVVSARIEARVAELQTLPARVSTLLAENATTVGDAYVDLAKRGETLVERIRKQQSTKATVTSAGTTKAKAKTTKTQATKATKTTAKKTAKKATSTAKKTSTAPKSSAKATTTAAKKTVSSAAQATTEGAAKIGD